MSRTTQIDQTEAIRQILADCYDDPSRFNEVVLARAPYWSRQRELARSVASYHTTIAETGNSIGKGYFLAGVVLWWLFTRPNALVVTTAPTQTLLGTVLFKEIRRAEQQAGRVDKHGRSHGIKLGVNITMSERASPQTVTIAPGWGALGIATRGVERLSGQHAAHLLVAVDEGTGVEDEIWDALESQNPAKMVVCYNPIRADGRAIALAQQAEREAKDASIPDSKRVNLINIPSTDSPDIHLERSERGLADAGFIDRVKRRFGEESLWYRTHILAIRPTVSHDTLIPADWLDRCCGRARSDSHAWGVRRMGVDLGEGVGRDKTVIVIRDDLGVREIKASHGISIAETAAQMALLAAKWHVSYDKITYDALGIGRDLPPHLARHRITEAVAYKGSFSGGPSFQNLRTAAAWRVRNFLDPTRPGHTPFAIPNDEHWPHLREELLALKYDLNGTKTRLEPKEDLTKRLGHSPDYADAFIQTFASSNS